MHWCCIMTGWYYIPTLLYYSPREHLLHKLRALHKRACNTYIPGLVPGRLPTLSTTEISVALHLYGVLVPEDRIREVRPQVCSRPLQLLDVVHCADELAVGAAVVRPPKGGAAPVDCAQTEFMPTARERRMEMGNGGLVVVLHGSFHNFLDFICNFPLATASFCLFVDRVSVYLRRNFHTPVTFGAIASSTRRGTILQGP